MNGRVHGVGRTSFGIRYCGASMRKSRRTLSRRTTSIAASTAVPQTSPSPWAAWVSPTDSSALRRRPAGRATCRRGGASCPCFPPSAKEERSNARRARRRRRSCPGTGDKEVIRQTARDRLPDRARRCEATGPGTRRRGAEFGNDRRPSPVARLELESTTSTSPGRAPLTKRGPLTGLTCVKSSFRTSSAPEVA